MSRLAAVEILSGMVSQTVLRSVLALEDPIGVLSVYVGVNPEEGSSPRPAWELELRHGLADARARLEAGADPTVARALQERIDQLREELDLTVSPRESGRGRALFAGLSGGDTVRLSLRQPFRTQVTVAGCALARPLAAALEAGRPAGLLIVSEDELRVGEWRLGEVAELRTIPVVQPDDRRQLLGPSAGRPRGAPQAGPGFRSGQQRDLYERRAEDARVHFLTHIPFLADLVAERGWDDLVLGGAEPLAAALLEHLRERVGVELVLEPRLLGWLSPAELAEAVAPALEQERARRQLASVERARGQALAGGRGAIGLADTVAALSEGRVELLLLPAERELRGSRTPDGRLFPPDVAPPGVSPAELRPEDFLAERMLQRAVSTDVRVSLLCGKAEAALGTDEAAALLRW
jgi:hypothetical protein